MGCGCGHHVQAQELHEERHWSSAAGDPRRTGAAKALGPWAFLSWRCSPKSPPCQLMGSAGSTRPLCPPVVWLLHPLPAGLLWGARPLETACNSVGNWHLLKTGRVRHVLLFHARLAHDTSSPLGPEPSAQEPSAGGLCPGSTLIPAPRSLPGPPLSLYSCPVRDIPAMPCLPYLPHTDRWQRLGVCVCVWLQ